MATTRQEQRKRILVEEDGTATLEHDLVIIRQSRERSETRVKPIGRKRVDATALEPDRGQLPILPLHCRGVRQRDGTSVFILEEDPGVRTVQWLTREGVGYQAMVRRLLARGTFAEWAATEEAFRNLLRTQETFSLAFPYLVKIFVFVGDICQEVCCYYRYEPILNANDELLIPNLPNAQTRDGERHHLCLPDAVRNLRCGPGVSYADVMTTIEQAFWGSSWNAHWSEDFLLDAQRIPEVASPWDWELATARDDRFALRVPWRPCERTLGELVEGILGTTPDRSATFACFERRVREADVWDGAPLGTHDAVSVSPSRIIAIANGVLEVGGMLTLTPWTFPECRDGGTFAIAWFGKADHGSRFVKLDGIFGPIRAVVQGDLVAGVTYARDPAAHPVVLNGVVVEAGTIIQFLNREEWVRQNGMGIIQSVRCDAQGSISVQLVGEHVAFVIGNGTTLEGGLRLLPKEEYDADGNLRADAVTLGDGTEVRVGDRLYVFGGAAATLARVTVDGFKALVPPATMVRCAFSRAHGLIFFLEDANGHLHEQCIRVPAEPLASLPCGRTTVSVGDRVRHLPRATTATVREITPAFPGGTHYALLSTGQWVVLAQGGDLHPDVTHLPQVTISDDGQEVHVGTTIIRAGLLFDAQTAWLLSVKKFVCPLNGLIVAICDDGSPETVVRDGDLVRMLTPVRASIPIGTMELARGMALRLVRDVRGHRRGKEFIVHHVDAPPERSSNACTVVTMCGLGFELTRENAALFEWRDALGAWRTFPEDTSAYAAPSNRRGGEGLGVGMRVRYLGGDLQTDFVRLRDADARAMRTPATIVAVKRSRKDLRWTCEFDEAIPGCHTNGRRRGEQRYQHILPQFLEPLAHASATLLETGFSRIFAADGVPSATPGEIIGRDRNGRNIRIGDRVRVRRLTGDTTRAATWHNLLRRPFTVVHGSHRGAAFWLWLDAGKDIGERQRATLSGAHRLPADCVSDAAWWRRITYADIRECVVVD